jgi:MacB-like periplasmic core domain
MLLIGAGLLIRTLWALLQVDPGFRAERVLTMDVALTSKYSSGERIVVAYAELLERVGRLPGVVSAGATQRLPVRGEPYGESFQIEGRPMRSPGDLLEMQYRVVTPGYFSAMQIPLRQGRLLSEQDTETSPRIAVISERLARLHFPNESPIGRRVTINDPKNGPWEDAGLAAKRGIAVITTCAIVPTLPLAVIRRADLLQVLKTQLANLKLLHESDVTLAIGSDNVTDTSVKEIEYLQKLGVFDNLTLLKMWTETTAIPISSKRSR